MVKMKRIEIDCISNEAVKELKNSYDAIFVFTKSKDTVSALDQIYKAFNK